MAKANGPLFSLSAQGSIKKALTFMKRNKTQTVRNYKAPTRIRTAKQLIKRRIFSFVTAEWQGLSLNDKEIWNTKAKEAGNKISGYQMFTAYTAGDIYNNHKLTAYWAFNEMTANKVNNEIGNYSILTGLNYFIEPKPYLVFSKNRKLDKAAHPGDQYSYFRVAHNSKINPREGDFYFDAWFYTTDINYTQWIYAKTGGSPKNGWRVELNAKKLKVFVDFNGLFVATTAPKILTQNKWHFIGVKIDRTNGLQLYLDGEKDGGAISLATVAGDINPTVSGTIGQTNNSIKGYIDEICLYQRALTDAEVRSRYQMAFKN